MNQAERVHQQPSNLITGIAVVGAPIQTAACGRSWWTIPLKTRCLGRPSRGSNGSQEPLRASTGVQFVSVPKGQRETISGLRAGTKNTTFQNFGFVLTTLPRVGRLTAPRLGACDTFLDFAKGPTQSLLPVRME